MDWVNLVKPPKQQPIQDVLSIAEVQAIINATRQLRYQVYYLTTYSLGLRLSESLNFTIADIDSEFMQVHLRYTKSKKDRLVPLPQATLLALRRYWATHRHPTLIFPGGKPPHTCKGKTMMMDKGGIQKTIKDRLQNYLRFCFQYSQLFGAFCKQFSASYFVTIPKLVAKECGISKNVHVHTLRHSIATHMTEEVEQNSALMLNDIVDSISINWQDN